MMIKAPLKRILKNDIRTAGVYYGFIITIFLILPFLARLIPHMNMNSNGGFEACTMIFIFIVGLVGVKSNLKTNIALSRSRTTTVVTMAISLVVMALSLSIIDSLLNPLVHIVHRQISDFGLVFELYGTGSYWAYLVWRFFLYLILGCGGCFLASLNYRMNKILRWCFWVGVPSMLFIAMPIVAVAENGVAYTLGMIFYNCFFKSISNCCFSFAVLSIIFIGLSWVLLRKAPIDRE